LEEIEFFEEIFCPGCFIAIGKKYKMNKLQDETGTAYQCKHCKHHYIDKALKRHLDELKRGREVMEKTTRMATYYNKIKMMIIDQGYENEIMWVNNIPNPVDKDLFFKEYSWVVINSGMKNKVAEKIYKNFWNNNTPDFSTINHPNKNKSMKEVYTRLDFYFLHFMKSKNKLMFLKSLPHIGDITKYHLARNLGLNYAKPDRHLVRISSLFTYPNIQEFCKKLSNLTGDPIGIVDLVLWRFATLYPNYLELIKKEID